MRITWTPVTASPAMIARWIGAAPRQRGSSEACRLKQPSRGASSTSRWQDLAVGDHHGGVEVERREGRRSRPGRFIEAGVRTGRPRLSAKAWTGEGCQLLAAPARAGRLGIDGRDLVARRDQLGQGGTAKSGVPMKARRMGGL